MTKAAETPSTRATQALIRRTLCPNTPPKTPITELLPPLTSRNDVDEELYALLAMLLREYVQRWYGAITSDETLVTEIVSVFAHCSRGVEGRARGVDWGAVLGDEVAFLLGGHVDAYRKAESNSQSQTRTTYHALNPFPPLDATTPTQQLERERSYRGLLSEGILAVLLPTEELEDSCVRALLVEMLAELLIGNAVGRAAQPWVILEGLGVRMPWLDGLLQLVRFGAVHGPGRVADVDGVLDRLLSRTLTSKLPPLPTTLRTLRSTSSPNPPAGPSTPRPPSTEAEFLALRRRAALSLWRMLPWPAAGRLYFSAGDEAEALEQVDGLLAVWGDEYCNRHLVYALVELLVVRVLPELAERGVSDLWRERLG
ncbi:PXA domain-containing protein [Ophiocordyceps camponoti-floridani]|uniref:PXA domain-containing protein n=1 Tax=Ophiocordyceps camponoti-floridani TaxID=2030778 RepID=A0A8H4Q6X1_9HYPO|nr:PXA domain-containing protein [Ophiocordyceps camponoti-floridani]